MDDKREKKNEEEPLTRQEIYELAYVELGLEEEEFFSMPPWEFNLKLSRHFRKIERMWEQTRYMAAMMYNTSMGARSRIRPKELIRLSFDKRKKYHWKKEEAIRLIEALTGKKYISN